MKQSNKIKRKSFDEVVSRMRLTTLLRQIKQHISDKDSTELDLAYGSLLFYLPQLASEKCSHHVSAAVLDLVEESIAESDVKVLQLVAESVRHMAGVFSAKLSEDYLEHVKKLQMSAEKIRQKCEGSFFSRRENRFWVGLLAATLMVAGIGLAVASLVFVEVTMGASYALLIPSIVSMAAAMACADRLMLGYDAPLEKVSRQWSSACKSVFFKKPPVCPVQPKSIVVNDAVLLRHPLVSSSPQ